MNKSTIFDPFDVHQNDDDPWESRFAQDFNGSVGFFNSTTRKPESSSNQGTPFRNRGFYEKEFTDYNSKNVNRSQLRDTISPENIRIFASLREEITCLYDSLSHSQYSVVVEGEITTNFTNATGNVGRTFYLGLQDPSHHIDTVRVSLESVHEVINESNLTNPSDQRLFRVHIPAEMTKLPRQLLKYTCTQNLRPLPLKMEIKSHIVDKTCHVRISMQCNRSYLFGLHNITVLMSVPPGIQGESIIASRKECKWDPLKRLVVWSIPVLKSGTVVEDSMKFHMNSAEYTSQSGSESPNFPAIIRCTGSDRISGIDINIGMMSKDLQPNQKLEADVSRSFVLIHRFI